MSNSRVVLALACGALLLPGHAAPVGGVERLAWLSGCWASTRAEPGSGEFWTPARGGTLLGIARTIRNGVTVSHEFLEIRADAPSGLALTAHPSGQASTRFALAQISERQVLFESPEHDFPTRIGYRLQADGNLLAWIEGPDGDGTRRIEFPMRRSACDPTALPAGPSG